MNSAIHMDRIMSEAMRLSIYRMVYDKATEFQPERDRAAGDVMRQERKLIDTVMAVMDERTPKEPR